MARSKASDRLRHILEAIDIIESIAANRTFAEYEANAEFKGAVERYVLLIAEACRHLPSEPTDLHPTLPWRRIADLGNVIRHAYDQIDDRIIWDIVRRRLKPLREAVSQLLATASE